MGCTYRGSIRYLICRLTVSHLSGNEGDSKTIEATNAIVQMSIANESQITPQPGSLSYKQQQALVLYRLSCLVSGALWYLYWFYLSLSVLWPPTIYVEALDTNLATLVTTGCYGWMPLSTNWYHITIIVTFRWQQTIHLLVNFYLFQGPNNFLISHSPRSHSE